MQQYAQSMRRGDILSGRRWVVGLCILVGVAALPATPTNAAELAAVSLAAPAKSGDKRLDDLLAAQKGRPVVINFWATWCEPCREELPLLQRLGQRWRERGLTVLTVAVADNLQRIDDFLWESEVDLPFIDDREQVISRLWGARALPTTFILDRRHRIRFRVQGTIDWDSPVVDQKLLPLLN